MKTLKSDPKVVQNPNPCVPLAALVQFDAGEPTTVRVSLDDGETRRHLTFDQSNDPAAGLPLLCLRECTLHNVSLEMQFAQGEVLGPFELQYTTPALPRDSTEYPHITVTETSPEEVEPGYTFLTLWRRAPMRPMWMTQKQFDFFRNWGMIVCIDQRGRIVWAYQTDKQIQGIVRLPNGNIFYHTEHYQSVEIDMLGNEVRKFHAISKLGHDVPGSVGIDAASIHHMPHHMENGNFLCLTAHAREIENYYASETDPTVRATKKVIGDAIIEFSPDGEIVWEWNAFDYLDPFRVGYNFTNYYWHVRGFPHHYDWTHGNGVCHDPHDDTVLVSFRHQCAILKISRKTKDIVWILGTHDGWEPQFHSKLLTPVGDDFDWHWHGHNPRVTGPDSFVMYDNRNLQAMPFDPPKGPGDCFARAVEYHVDPETMTVKQLWTSRDTEESQVLSWAMGDAHRLPVTDNFLVVDSSCTVRDEPLTYSGTAHRSDLSWDNFDRSAFVMADFPTWVRIRELKGNETAEVLWEATIKHPHEVIGWEVFGGFRTPSLYPDGVEATEQTAPSAKG